MLNTTFDNKKILLIIAVFFILMLNAYADESNKPLILQEMTWKEVKDYLKSSDMVIIPIGSTEQHGPHLPLGTDYYEATEISKMISAGTGVIVAPVLLAGYSVYHNGFPGTLSLKPETMELVLFETAEMLIKYGFRRLMFFNYHGGNNIVCSKIIHKINHSTGAIAVNIGIGAPYKWSHEDAAPFDYHAGIGETSIMLYLKPELVKMDKVEKPIMTFTEKMKELQDLSKKNPALASISSALQGVPVETRKGGASHEISNNGIWTLGDPKKATRERGEKIVKNMVKNAVTFISAWKEAKK